MAIAFDTTAQPSNFATGTTFTWTHVLSASATDLVVVMSSGTDTNTITAKCGSTNMVSLGKFHSNNSNGGFLQVFGLTSPPTGSQTITLTATINIGSGCAGSMSFTGSAGYGTPANNEGSSAVASCVVPTTTVGNWCVAGVANGSPIGTSSNTSRFVGAGDPNSGAGYTAGSTDVSTGSAVTMQWAVTSDWWAVIAFELLAAGAGPPPAPLISESAAFRAPAFRTGQRGPRFMPTPTYGTGFYPKLATLTDNFNTGTTPDATKWTGNSVNNAVDITLASSQLNLLSPATNTQYTQLYAEVGGIYSYFDLTNSATYINLISPGNQSLASLECYPLYLTDETYNATSPNQLFWYLNGNQISTFKRVNGTQTQVGSSTGYVNTTHAWLRIREAGGTVFFETSTDGNTWNAFSSTPDIPNITRLNLWIQNGTYASEVSATTCIYDNLSTPAVTTAGTVSWSGTAGMTVGALVTEIVGITETATAGMTVGASVNEIAAVSLAATAGLTISPVETMPAVVAMSNANKLIVDDWSFESGSIGSWVGTGLALTNTTAVATGGTHSMAMTATGTTGGSASTATNLYPAIPGYLYNGTVRVLAATTVRHSAATIAFYNAAGSLLTSTTGTVVLDQTGPWSVLSVSSTAPANTVWVALGWINTDNASAIGEVHYIDQLNLSQSIGATASMTVGSAGAVTEVASASFAASTTMTVGSLVTEIAAVSEAATAALTVDGTSAAGINVTMAATAGMTIATLVNQLANVVMAGGATLIVPATITELAGVNEVATAGMIVGSLVTEVASVAMTATSGLTVPGVITRFGVVSEVATAGMTVGGLVTQVASVVMSDTTTLIVTGIRTQLGVVPLAATSGLTVSALDTEFASVSFAALSGMLISNSGIDIGSVNMAAIAGLITTGFVTEIAAVNMAAVTSLNVLSFVTKFASINLSASAALIINSFVSYTFSVHLAATGTLFIATTGTQNATVNLSATAALLTAGTVTYLVSVPMVATAGLAIPGTVFYLPSVALLANSILTAGGTVTPGIGVHLLASGNMNIAGTVSLLAAIAMLVNTKMTVIATVIEMTKPTYHFHDLIRPGADLYPYPTSEPQG